MLPLKLWSYSHSYSIPICRTLTSFSSNLKLVSLPQSNASRFIKSQSIIPNIYCCNAKSVHQHSTLSSNHDASSSNSTSPISGIESDLVSYIFGKKKATEVAHLVWKHVVQKGDVVVDATCGNGYDTLAMLKMVADGSGGGGGGGVYGLDIQKDALQNTSSLLEESVSPNEKELVKLFTICHSKMEEVVPGNSSVRLVAFNLGYLPGGDKALITMSGTTLLALEAAERIVMRGGLISLVVYVGHPGGREESETIEAFACGLSVDTWICCKFQMLNRPLAPLLVFLFKR